MLTPEENNLLIMARGLCHAMLNGSDADLLARRWPGWKLTVDGNELRLVRTEPVPEAPLPHVTTEGQNQAKPAAVVIPPNDELAGARRAAQAAGGQAPTPLLAVK